MPVPVFFFVSHLRSLLNMPLARVAKELGIATSYLYYLETFDRPPDSDLTVCRKATLAEATAAFLSSRVHIPVAFHFLETPRLTDPCEIRLCFEREALFHQLFSSPLLLRLLEDPLFLNTLLPLLSAGAYQPREWHVKAPHDANAARALWWFFSRFCGSLTGHRRREEKGIMFVPDAGAPDVFSAAPGRPLGRLHDFPSLQDPGRTKLLRLWLYLIAEKLLVCPASPPSPKVRSAWREWYFTYNASWRTRAGRPGDGNPESSRVSPSDRWTHGHACRSREVFWFAVPDFLPPPAFAAVFLTCFPPEVGKVTVFWGPPVPVDGRVAFEVHPFCVVLGDHLPGPEVRNSF
ncbi:hypothetical protein Adeg_0743 [Ammonifex degensii KC4]|uniref:Uncharacterized protein n=1 Tax=Ammonifex degensii (strain DSM 10501 / KC4) TaxID=429009 RepID=C9RCB2_AMMDK|nr:hypothetical protein [Ammonifex degensii]ACX51889.1 hypothetical protein Adeg_0743 [Ammonifex degensii KC4]